MVSEAALTEEKLEAYEKLTANLELLIPSLFMVPNVAQYRALDAMYPAAGRMPDWTSIEFANGCGKSALMILDMIGWTMGPEYLLAEAYPPNAIKFYKNIAPLRDSKRLNLRLCCVADDMKAGGSVCDLLHQIFPWAKVGNPDSAKCFKEIAINHPTLSNVRNTIAVKTFDQEELKHSGSTCNRIWINEQLYDSLYGETIGRIRSKDGVVDGTIAQFATVIQRNNALSNLEGSEHFELKRLQGHLYENCVGEEVTDEMADEVWNDIGIQMEKNPNGKGYVTNGVLKRSKILSLVEGWMRTCPHQLEARKSGKPISGGGKIFPTYLQDVHVIANETYENCKDYPVGQVVDPHYGRPNAAIWFKVLPNDRLVVVDEFPSVAEFGYFDQIKEKRFTVQQTCEMWRQLEANREYAGKIGDNRIGDPNMFLMPNSDNTGNLHSLYSAEGYNFNLNIIDEFEFGIELVAEYLYYDQQMRRMHPDDPAAQPRLVISKRCENTSRALAFFGRKVSSDSTKPMSEEVDKRFACFASLIRYLVVWHRTHRYEDIKKSTTRQSDSDLIRMGRVPKSLRGGSFGSNQFNFHGRKPMNSYR